MRLNEVTKKSRKFISKPEDLCHVNTRNVKTLLRVGEVNMRSETNVCDVFALFDKASSLFMLDSSLAGQMQLGGSIIPITCRWMNGGSHNNTEFRLVSSQISLVTWYELENVRTIENSFEIGQIYRYNNCVFLDSKPQT